MTCTNPFVSPYLLFSTHCAQTKSMKVMQVSTNERNWCAEMEHKRVIPYITLFYIYHHRACLVVADVGCCSSNHFFTLPKVMKALKRTVLRYLEVHLPPKLSTFVIFILLEHNCCCWLLSYSLIFIYFLHRRYIASHQCHCYCCCS